MRRQQYTILYLRRKLKHRVPRPVPRNLIWEMDLLTKTDTPGRPHLALAIINHASRACLCVQRLTDKSLWTIWHHLVTACRPYGCPSMLRTDNEAVFTSRALRFALDLLGIRLQHSEPGCPWQNGRVEWLIGTIKRLLRHHAINDATSLDRALVYTRAVYNHLRPISISMVAPPPKSGPGSRCSCPPARADAGCDGGNGQWERVIVRGRATEEDAWRASRPHGAPSLVGWTVSSAGWMSMVGE